MAFELTGNPLNDISAPIEELSESFNSTLVFDFGNGVGITQYTFWMIIICAIVLFPEPDSPTSPKTSPL